MKILELKDNEFTLNTKILEKDILLKSNIVITNVNKITDCLIGISIASKNLDGNITIDEFVELKASLSKLFPDNEIIESYVDTNKYIIEIECFPKYSINVS